MNVTINIENKFNNMSEKDLKNILENILSEYNDHDIYLLKKYYEYVNLPDDKFINIE